MEGEWNGCTDINRQYGGGYWDSKIGEENETKKLLFIGPWGGNGGNYWDDGCYTGVREIMIMCGDSIDSIRILYDKNGMPVLSEKHGGSGGSSKTVKLQWPEEYLIGVSGNCGRQGHNTVLRSLTFKSNWKKYGPFGKESGAAFSVPIEGGKIVGFKGRSGSYLDGFGVYVSPA